MAGGLQLVALRLRDRADTSGFIERFTGADWHIVSYLGDEVLDSRAPANSCSSPRSSTGCARHDATHRGGSEQNVPAACPCPRWDDAVIRARERGLI
jgi:hypothetical protein